MSRDSRSVLWWFTLYERLDLSEDARAVLQRLPMAINEASVRLYEAQHGNAVFSLHSSGAWLYELKAWEVWFERAIEKYGEAAVATFVENNLDAFRSRFVAAPSAPAPKRPLSKAKTRKR